MRMIDESSITQLLENASAGDAGAMDRVVAMLYNDLKSRAKLHLRKQFGAAAFFSKSCMNADLTRLL
jgi:hypothetical protein